MLRVGLISDTHGYLDAWEKALVVFQGVDFAVHAGDILSSGPFNPRLRSYQPVDLAEALNNSPFPIVFAKGNCDADVDSNALDYPIQAPYALAYADGLTIMATHGHTYTDEQLFMLGHRYKLDVLVTGHSHEHRIVKDGNLHLVNPGSAAFPKGPGDVPTVGLIEEGRIKIVSLENGAVLEDVAMGLG